MNQVCPLFRAFWLLSAHQPGSVTQHPTNLTCLHSPARSITVRHGNLNLTLLDLTWTSFTLASRRPPPREEMSIVGLWAHERVEALGDSDAPEPLLQLIARPGRIACLSARSICIWRTFPRSLLARCQPGTSSSQEPAEDAHYRMAWHPDGTHLAAISRGTRMYLYTVASPELRRRQMQRSHGSPMPLRPSVQQSLAAHCAGSLTCVSADATAVLIGMGGPDLGKGNSGRSPTPASWALVSWSGELLRVLGCAGPAAPLVAMTPALALGTPSAPPSPPPVAAPAPPPAIAPPPTPIALTTALPCTPCSSTLMATRAASQPAQYSASPAFRPGRPVRSRAAAPITAAPITEPSTPLVQRRAVTAACAAAVDVHEPRRGEHLHAAAADVHEPRDTCRGGAPAIASDTCRGDAPAIASDTCWGGAPAIASDTCKGGAPAIASGSGLDQRMKEKMAQLLSRTRDCDLTQSELRQKYGGGAIPNVFTPRLPGSPVANRAAAPQPRHNPTVSCLQAPASSTGTSSTTSTTSTSTSTSTNTSIGTGTGTGSSSSSSTSRDADQPPMSAIIDVCVAPGGLVAMVLGAEDQRARHIAGGSRSAGAGASGGLTTTTSGCAVVAWALGTTRARQGLAALLDERPGRRSYATSCLEPRGAICIAAHSRVHPHHTTPHHAPTFGGAPAASAACHPPSALGMALGAMTVAVGLADGSVALFHVHLNAEPSSESPANSPQLVATRACSLSLGAWGYDRSATGGVSCLAACKCSPRRPHPTGTIYTPQAA